MEENKYYTPEIEELHIGFEYEILDLASTEYGKSPEKAIWNKEELKTSDLYSSYKQDSYIETLASYLKSENLRVKYLDREDIESLGWEHDEYAYDKSDPYSLIIFDKEGIKLHYDVEDHTVTIHRKDDYMIRDIIIKNKSELKKVLKMIGV
jgi:hypothetical protein